MAGKKGKKAVPKAKPKLVDGKRILSAAGRKRRKARKKMGIKDTRKASKQQIVKARKAGALPGKGSQSGFEMAHPRGTGGLFRKK